MIDRPPSGSLNGFKALLRFYPNEHATSMREMTVLVIARSSEQALTLAKAKSPTPCLSAAIYASGPSVLKDLERRGMQTDEAMVLDSTTMSSPTRPEANP